MHFAQNYLQLQGTGFKLFLLNYHPGVKQGTNLVLHRAKQLEMMPIVQLLTYMCKFFNKIGHYPLRVFPLR